jgi:hypothetical protein
VSGVDVYHNTTLAGAKIFGGDERRCTQAFQTRQPFLPYGSAPEPIRVNMPTWLRLSMSAVCFGYLRRAPVITVSS